MPQIVNSLTGIATPHKIGSPDEKLYFRVTGGPNVDRLNPQKRFYQNKTEFFLDSLFKRYGGQIEHMETAIRANIGSVENKWGEICSLPDKKGLRLVISTISNSPTITFSAIEPTFRDGFITV
tara:strand:+ start:369 stop:737 length:369 start_codon:yes stop_codon:yes gene_type:complete